MIRTRERVMSLNSSIGILVLIGILILSLISCESIFGPSSEETTEEDEDEEARIIVYNNYGEALNIYLDGEFQFLLGHKGDKKIHNVSLNEHELEAKRPNTNTTVDSETIDVTSYTDYTWTIDDPPDINVSNQYGKTLKIYMDDIYQFDLVDEEDRWIIDVSFGEHFLKAIKTATGQEVASTTIDIEENKDYSWVIE
jgi:hypothetical protein